MLYIVLEAPFPVPTDEASVVVDAKDTFVEWPKHLIRLKVNKHYPHKSAIPYLLLEGQLRNFL